MADLDQLDDYVDPAETEQEGASGKKDTVQGSYAGVQACSFRDMLLKAELQRAIGDAGFEHPSEVQQNAIPFAMVFPIPDFACTIMSCPTIANGIAFCWTS